MKRAPKPGLLRWRRCAARLPTVVAAMACLVAPAEAQAPATDPAETAEATAEVVDPATNRLFFAPTGRTLPEGKWQVGSYMIVAPYVNYAFTDDVMVSAGTPLIFWGGFGSIWYVAPKIRVYDGDRVDVALGGLGLVGLDLDGGSIPLGIHGNSVLAWGVTTVGDEARSVTLGLARHALGTNLSGTILIGGGELRLRKRERDDGDQTLKLVAEAYNRADWHGRRTAALAGLRFHEATVSFELMAVYSDNEFKRFPLLAMTFDL